MSSKKYSIVFKAVGNKMSLEVAFQVMAGMTVDNPFSKRLRALNVSVLKKDGSEISLTNKDLLDIYSFYKKTDVPWSGQGSIEDLENMRKENCQ
jgi:uncharacterized protein YfkK (UPF0435 family)